MQDINAFSILRFSTKWCEIKCKLESMVMSSFSNGFVTLKLYFRRKNFELLNNNR